MRFVAVAVAAERVGCLEFEATVPSTVAVVAAVVVAVVERQQPSLIAGVVVVVAVVECTLC